MNWACDRKDRQLPGNDQPHSRLTGTIPRCRPTQLTARYAAIHAKKWIGDDPSVYDNSQQQQQQQYTQRRADAEIPENLGSKPKHEIGGDLVEEVAHSDFNFSAVSSGIAISANHLHSAGDCGSNRFPTLWNLFRRSSLSLTEKHRCKKSLNRGHLTPMRLIGKSQKMQRSSHRKISLKRSKTGILVESGNILTGQRARKRR
jgi:hypothetical protein